ncbi:hypothetical protein H0H92_010712 [Tricholoma furcatifolium]|nr:hypothetical protein H0H92_010712 [Tricholoma furcatifolium]
MNRISALFRVLCVLAASISFHITYTPPSRAAADEQTAGTDLGEKVIKSNMKNLKCVKGTFWAVGIAEVLAIIASQLPPSNNTHIVLQALLRTGDIDDLKLSPLFLAGLVLLVSGAGLRWICYCELKNLFTFELSIRKDHRLVTSGPYSVVRHPSYTGLIAVHAGMYGWYAARGSWVMESGLMQTKGGFMTAVIFYVGGLLGMASVVRRISVEDRELKKAFGSEWVHWANKVKYTIIPGIY